MAFRPFLCLRIDEDTMLRIYEERHAQEVAEMVDQNRTYLRKWLPWVDDSRTVEDSRAFIRNSLQLFAQNVGFQMGIWYRGKLAGGIGYHAIDWVDRKVEIGYYTTQLRSSLILCDDDWGWLTLNLPPKRAVQSASLELSQANNGLLRDCIDHFERCWEIVEQCGQSFQVLPKKHETSRVSKTA